MDSLLLGYCVLAAALILLVTALVRHGNMMESGVSRFFGVLLLSSAATLVMVGPLGLILGGPSILLSAFLVARVFGDPSRKSQDNKNAVLPTRPSA